MKPRSLDEVIVYAFAHGAIAPPSARRLHRGRRKETGMSDDLSKKGQQDRDRINVDEDYELTYWSQKFGVSRDRLREAVAKAGPMVKNVERELRG
jgi:hypothetical protein